MANVLAELFGDIADAIREKTGSTDKMSPAAFPEKISAIEAGGGSSLPAGIYYKESEIGRPGIYNQRIFEFNGETYAVMNANTTNSIVNFYKYADGKWTSIISSFDAGLARFNAGHSVNVYNGKVHLAGNGMKAHVVFDGTTAVKCNDLPYACYYDSMCVHDDKLMYNNSGKFYEWDETSDTWRQVGTKVATSGAYNSSEGNQMISVGDALFYCHSTKLYKVANIATGAVEEMCPFTPGIMGIVAKGACIYCFSSGSKMYCFDTTTNELRELGLAARVGGVPATFVLGDKIHQLIVSAGSFACHMELDIIEAEE